jgi:SAM-dependent methyltransferase
VSTANPYDEVPYPSGAVEVTHPGNLAMMAQLFGMQPAPVERCRVLELGCGDGMSLLPLAELFPESTFVGVDRSAAAVAAGRAWADRIGVTNLTFVEADLASYDPGPEPFDYVVAHGVYSWVPADVRDRLLAIFGRALAPQGVAFVSYTALPGGYFGRAMREMIAYHTRGTSDPAKRVAQARAFAAFLADAAPPHFGPYKAMLAEQSERISTCADDDFVRDDLAGRHDAFYFHQVIEHAARHGLAYLAEVGDEAFPTGDVLAFEQHRDFVVGRSSRATLLVRNDVVLERR